MLSVIRNIYFAMFWRKLYMTRQHVRGTHNNLFIKVDKHSCCQAEN